MKKKRQCGFRTSPTQTELYMHKIWLDARNFGFRALKNYGSLYLACNDRKAFYTSSDQVNIHFGHVRMCAMPYPISWIIFISDLGPSYTGKMLEFRWVPIAHPS